MANALQFWPVLLCAMGAILAGFGYMHSGTEAAQSQLFGIAHDLVIGGIGALTNHAVTRIAAGLTGKNQNPTNQNPQP